MTVNATTTITNLPAIVPAQLTPAAFVAVDGANGVTGKVAANALPFLQSGTGAIVRSANSKMGETLSVTDFGAKGDGVTDDSAAIQAAIDAAGEAGRGVYLPVGSYLISATLTVSHPTSIRGGSTATSILLVSPSLGAGVDVLHFIAASGDPNFRFFTMSDFSIVHPSGSSGRYGIVLDGANNAVCCWTIERVSINGMGTSSIFLTSSSVTSFVFLGSIHDCTLEGGVVFNNAGDSIRVQNNKFFGSTSALSGTFFLGANQLLVTGNNITNATTMIDLTSAFRPAIVNNQFESAQGGSYPTGLIHLAGSSAVLLYEPFILGNVLNALAVSGTDGIHLDYVANAQIGPNVIAVATPGVGVVTTANTIAPRIDVAGASWAVGPTKVSDVSGTAICPVYAPFMPMLLATGAGHSVDDVITALQNLGLVKQ